MPPPNELTREARAPVIASTERITQPLALALAVASGALLERPDGVSPLPAVLLFVVALLLVRPRG